MSQSILSRTMNTATAIDQLRNILKSHHSDVLNDVIEDATRTMTLLEDDWANTMDGCNDKKNIEEYMYLVYDALQECLFQQQMFSRDPLPKIEIKDKRLSDIISNRMEEESEKEWKEYIQKIEKLQLKRE